MFQLACLKGVWHEWRTYLHTTIYTEAILYNNTTISLFFFPSFTIQSYKRKSLTHTFAFRRFSIWHFFLFDIFKVKNGTIVMRVFWSFIRNCLLWVFRAVGTIGSSNLEPSKNILSGRKSNEKARNLSLFSS